MSFVSSPPRQVLSNRIRTILFTLAILLAIGVGYAYRQHVRYRNVAAHEPGILYRASWVEPDVLTDLISTHRIRTVVNLCEPGEMGEHRWSIERDTVRKAGARLLELPMPATNDPTDPALQTHLSALAEPSNFPMLVHCQSGTVRTSKFLAIYDMCFRGKSADESLETQPPFVRGDQQEEVQAFCLEVERHREDLQLQMTVGPSTSRRN